ncbi:hypothetical protein [Pleionea sediminis]|uniref:hypothetical protein n=1 Tax=Pleionea sediminis TaxID=2569479 RepID=UPI0011872BA0|nr:hypothetical protein [Pleionea sediminis]
MERASENRAAALSYFIYNNDDGWYLKIQDNPPVGPEVSYDDTIRKASILMALLENLEDVA